MRPSEGRIRSSSQHPPPAGLLQPCESISYFPFDSELRRIAGAQSRISGAVGQRATLAEERHADSGSRLPLKERPAGGLNVRTHP